MNVKDYAQQQLFNCVDDDAPQRTPALTVMGEAFVVIMIFGLAIIAHFV